MPLESWHYKYKEIRFIDKYYIPFLIEYTKNGKGMTKTDFAKTFFSSIKERDFEIDDAFMRGYFFSYQIMIFDDDYSAFSKKFGEFFNQEMFEIIENAIMEPDLLNQSFPGIKYNEIIIVKCVKRYVEENKIHIFPKLETFLRERQQI